MSEPNQKLIMIDRIQDLQANFLRIDNDFLINASNRLTHTGLKLYIYLITRVPHTYDEGKIINKKKGGKPYELSPADVAKEMNCHKKSAQNAIEELVEIGYIKLIKGNLYQFKDHLPEDRIKTAEEHEQIKDYMEESLVYLREEKDNRLRNIAREKIQEQFKEESHSKYDWE